ncbi:hypothetical protein AAAC51_28600 [Priestia megaterium]
MVVGPFIYEKYPIEILKELISNFGLSNEIKSLLAYHESIPLVKE